MGGAAGRLAELRARASRKRRWAFASRATWLASNNVLVTDRWLAACAEMGAAMLARPEPEQPAAAAPVVDNSAVELIQGMLMAQSQALAKFEKQMDERTSNLESMAMQAAMNGSKQPSQTGAPTSHDPPRRRASAAHG